MEVTDRHHDRDPRAALRAGEIAEEADFFSFGTNDLTQMTFGFSRDDVEGRMMSAYLEQGLLKRNPFEVVDPDGVGRAGAPGRGAGRATRPDLKIGVCGEHGGDPESIATFAAAGLDYVSCSPFRVPIARLAAAQAVPGRRSPRPATRPAGQGDAGRKAEGQGQVAKGEAAGGGRPRAGADRRPGAGTRYRRQPMGIPDEDVARVRAETDIVALIGEHAALKQWGGGGVGCARSTPRRPARSA